MTSTLAPSEHSASRRPLSLLFFGYECTLSYDMKVKLVKYGRIHVLINENMCAQMYLPMNLCIHVCLYVCAHEYIRM